MFLFSFVEIKFWLYNPGWPKGPLASAFRVVRLQGCSPMPSSFAVIWLKLTVLTVFEALWRSVAIRWVSVNKHHQKATLDPVSWLCRQSTAAKPEDLGSIPAHDGRREVTSPSCPLASTHGGRECTYGHGVWENAHMCVQIHTQGSKINVKMWTTKQRAA